MTTSRQGAKPSSLPLSNTHTCSRQSDMTEWSGCSKASELQYIGRATKRKRQGLWSAVKQLSAQWRQQRVALLPGATTEPARAPPPVTDAHQLRPRPRSALTKPYLG